MIGPADPDVPPALSRIEPNTASRAGVGILIRCTVIGVLLVPFRLAFIGLADMITGPSGAHLQDTLLSACASGVIAAGPTVVEAVFQRPEHFRSWNMRPRPLAASLLAGLFALLGLGVIEMQQVYTRAMLHGKGLGGAAHAVEEAVSSSSRITWQDPIGVLLVLGYVPVTYSLVTLSRLTHRGVGMAATSAVCGTLLIELLSIAHQGGNRSAAIEVAMRQTMEAGLVAVGVYLGARLEVRAAARTAA